MEAVGELTGRAEYCSKRNKANVQCRRMPDHPGKCDFSLGEALQAADEHVPSSPRDIRGIDSKLDPDDYHPDND